MRCLSPVRIKDPHNEKEFIFVPCGKCWACQERKKDEWAVRVQWEVEHSATSAYFITLTYRDENLPFLEDAYGKIPIVCKRDCQLFMKRLRKRNKQKIKYFLVSEYGPHTYRPHYHAIIIGLDKPEYIEASWQLGNVLVSEVNQNRINYCCRYCIGIPDLPGYIKYRKEAHVFQLQSKGLGEGFITPEIVEYYTDDHTRNYVMQNGFKKALPRYWERKIIEKAKFNGKESERYKDTIRELRSYFKNCYHDKMETAYQEKYEEEDKKAWKERRPSRKLQVMKHYEEKLWKQNKMRKDI